MHIVYPLLLGPNRGRYFLLTGQIIPARQAQELGLVNEVLPSDKLLPRAWELAEQVLRQPPLTRRYARVAVTQEIKRQLLDLLGYGLVLEGLAALDSTPDK
jgi:enoyl-CoA hydratase/carnithine racemase